MSFSSNKGPKQLQSQPKHTGAAKLSPEMWENQSARSLPVASKGCRICRHMLRLSSSAEVNFQLGQTNLLPEVNQHNPFPMPFGVSVKVPFCFTGLLKHILLQQQTSDGRTVWPYCYNKTIVYPTHRKRPFPKGKHSGMCPALHDLCSTVQTPD